MKIVVTGDIAVDRAIAHTSPSHLSHWVDHTAHTFDLEGGACLVTRLIEAAGQELTAKKPAFSLETIGPKFTELNSLPDDAKHITASIWEPQPKQKDKSKGPGKVWRVTRYLGRNKGPDKQGQPAPAGAHPMPIVAAAMPTQEAMTDADLVVLDDGAFGFRNAEDGKRFWPAAIESESSERQPWILLKMSRPVAQGDLWNRLLERHADRLVVVIPIADLRLTEVRISREFSWEQTAEDLAWELVHNPRVNALSQCAHVVVFFGAAGAILVSKVKPKAESSAQPPAPPKLTYRLFFDPAAIEGDWEEGYPGKVIGGGSCLTAALALQFMMQPEEPCLEAGIHSGLDAIRTLHKMGYGEYQSDGVPILRFPIEAVAGRMFRTARLALARHLSKGSRPAEAGQWASTAECKEEPKSPFAEAQVQEPRAHLLHPDLAADTCAARRPWTILEENVAGSIEQLARNVVLQGPQAALTAVPLGEFKKLLTVERTEIEGFRSIRNLIAEYDRSAAQNQPLSIAVFGAPGAGKSFGITQVAESLFPDRLERLTFNLSQFSSSADLLAALHRVRDAGLSGKLPLVFWDEFDTALQGTPLGWLRLFLAPMQDGSFQEGQILHPIGKAVFVFAGGTAHSMEAFSDRPQETAQDFKDAKGPDFVSRLKGYVNIMGPNPCSERDLQFVVRRAILLRSLLQRKAPDIFENPEKPDGEVHIDPGLLNAFLRIGHYRHGARSMESIIDMSSLSRNTRYERSSLPDEAQLELHVDSREFMARVQEVVIDPKALEILAEQVHEAYRAGEKARRALRADQDKDYRELAPEYQEQNRENARDIPTKLNLTGYIMIPARGRVEKLAFPGEDLEELAEWEHVRWLREKLARGWLYAPETDKPSRKNNCLLAWSCLPENEKAKDRDLVLSIPKILEAAGYSVFRLPDAARRRQKAQYRLDYHLTRIGVIGSDASLAREDCFAAVNKALKAITAAFGARGLTVITELTTAGEQMVAERVLLHPAARLFVPLSEETASQEKVAPPDKALAPAFWELRARADQIITPEQIEKWYLPEVNPGEKSVAAPPAERYPGLRREMAYILDHCDVLIAFGAGLEAGSATCRAVDLARGGKRALIVLPAKRESSTGTITPENFPLTDDNPM